MKLKHLFYAAAISTLAAACSEADELSSGIRSEKTLDAIHSGTDRFATRVNLNSEWESGDAIGVYMLDAGTGNIRNSAMNIQYNADVAEISTETNFVAAAGGIGIYDQPCDFVAYYPYSSGEEGKVDAGAGVYKIDLADQSAGIAGHDLMWAKVENKASDELLSSGLSMTFHHQLALLYVNIGNEDVKVENVKVNGLNTTAHFDLLKGELSVDDAPKAVTLHKLSDKSFVGVMLPVANIAKVMSVTIEAGGKIFQYMVPATSKISKFEAGYEYIFNINLKNSSGDLISGGNGSNEGWKPGENEGGDATETNPEIPSGYETIPVNGDTELTTVLDGASGKIALLFASGNDDCYMHDMSSVFESYGSEVITLTNSTFYKMSGQAIHPYNSKGAFNPTITIQHCTLVSLDKTPIQGTDNGCNIIYSNNVSAMIDPAHSNLSYNTTSSTGEGNYAAKNDDDGKVATGGFKSETAVTFNTDYKVSDLFVNAANGDLTLKIAVQAGDPRWYKSVE